MAGTRLPTLLVVSGITVASILFSLAMVVIFAPALGVTVTREVVVFVVVLPIVAAPAITLPLLNANRRLSNAQGALFAQARVDELTGLPNRRAFFEAAVLAFAGRSPKDHPVAVLMVDIDRFKATNDTHGHEAGDALLRAVAAGIRDTTAAAGARRAAVARIGGEEFAAIVEGLAPSAVARLAEAICRSARAITVTYGDGPIGTTVSVGVALVRAGGIDAALRLADDAVYAAKRAGRDRWAFAEGRGPSTRGEGDPAPAARAGT